MGSVMFSDQGILKAFKRAVSKRGWIVTLDKKFSHFKTLNCKSSFSRQKWQTRRKEVRRERRARAVVQTSNSIYIDCFRYCGRSRALLCF